MKITVISVNEIDKVLDEALSAYKNGEIRYTNIVFIGNAGIGRSSRIDMWLNKHLDEIAPHYLTPAVLMKEKTVYWSKIRRMAKHNMDLPILT